MKAKFKIGDKVTTNSILDEEHKCYHWWNEYKDTIMTITNINSYRNHTSYSVKENPYEWEDKWMLPIYEDFFKPEEFNL